MTIDFKQARELLEEFKLTELFIQHLGWSFPPTERAVSMELDGETYERQKIAELSGVIIFEITASNGQIPNAKSREAIYKDIAEFFHENLLIFINCERTQCLWYWVKQEEKKLYSREHVYVKREPCDLLLSKISALEVDPSELENGSPPVINIVQRLQTGFDVERVTKKFFEEFKEQHTALLNSKSGIQGIPNEADRRWYASVILNRLMFVYFLQRKGFIDKGKTRYLQDKLKESQQRGDNLFYEFLRVLFFEGFAKPQDQRSFDAQALIGEIKYLNGGLFLEHRIEQDYSITIPDSAFEKIFDLFSRYSWNLDDRLGGKENEINPSVLGYIFEKYINQKAFGAYYTRPEITEYLCERTINKLVLDRINKLIAPRNFESISDLLTRLDANLCRRLLEDILPNLSLLDPACGSGAFLIAAMKTLIYIYSAVIGSINFLTDHRLNNWLEQIKKEHRSLNYYIKKRIITDNLYGVDIMEEATEIAKLRLFLALVSSVLDVSELEALPNIDFNIMAGNSLVGLIRVDEIGFDAIKNRSKGKDKKQQEEVIGLQLNLLQSLASVTYKKILLDKNESIKRYKEYAFQSVKKDGISQDSSLLELRECIAQLNRESQVRLNLLLLDEFRQRLRIKYEECQLSGRAKKRILKVEDIVALKPFHWGYHFDRVLEQGGFDAIITNPPWEIFKPNAKEFFAQYSDLVKKKKMELKDFEKEQEKLLKDPEIAEAWLEYQNQFPYISDYYRLAEQYKNQVPIVNGKKRGTDVNLYKLFLEQCFNLLRPGGECGIVVPSGIYTDLGAKQLREMLFSQTQVTGLFCFENRKVIFEGVHRSFKLVVLTFEKGGKTEEFPAVFMRHHVQELQTFPNDESLSIKVELIRRFSPDSMSVMEFKSVEDLQIADKLLNYPLLYGSGSGWELELYGEELHMTRSKKYFHQTPTKYPLYEGGMIWQFDHRYDQPRYWIKESELREVFLEKRAKRIETKKEFLEDLINDYEVYRIAIRKIASNTNERTLISTIIPPGVFVGNSLTVNFPLHHSKDRYNDLRVSNLELLVIVSLLNSFVVDYTLRSRMTTNLNTFYLYQLPVPLLKPGDRFFKDIIKSAAKLICTTPDFDELAQTVGLDSHKQGVTDETERAQLRAELDGMIAHVYNLTKEEFTYILATFPIVSDSVKEAALEAYRKFAPMSGDPEIIDLIIQGKANGNNIEFKSTARWNLQENKQDPAMERQIVETVAAFLNTNGGALLIGVNDDGIPIGLQYDYQTLENKKNDGYMSFLNHELLLREIGKSYSTFFQISFHEVAGHNVCRVIVQPSPNLVSVKVRDKSGKGEDSFFIRSNKSNYNLTAKEAVEYCNNRVAWKQKLREALDTRSELVAPQRVVLCEGVPKGIGNPKKAEFDARCYRTIFAAEFPDTQFLSVGSSNEVETDRLALIAVIESLIQGVEVIRLVDRDDRSNAEIAELVRKNVRVLSRREIESYLFDDEILSLLCAKSGKPEQIPVLLAAKQTAINDSVNRGNPGDDIKSARGDIYNAAKKLLNLKGAGNTADAFCRDTLAPLVVPGTSIYAELKEDIFGL